MTQETTEERTERTEQAERPAPRFSESESPPAWLIATRGDLREMESRVNSRIDDAKADTRARIGDVNIRIDDAKAEINTRIDDAKAELGTRIDDMKTELGNRIDGTNARIDGVKADLGNRIDGTNARIDELKTEGRARDAKLDANTATLARIEENLKSDNRRTQSRAVWIGIAVAAVGIIIGIIMRLIS